MDVNIEDAMIDIDKGDLVTVVGALSSCIVLLGTLVLSWLGSIRKQLKACEKNHAKSQTEILEISVKLSRLEGEMDGRERFARQVLERVTDR